jgi:DNA-binding CsgD family transcriptional regulator
MAAYRLTDREQAVTRLVLQGSSTVEIATSLFIPTNTIQQHLKKVFEKTGVRSRRELVGKVFFAHYEPRVRRQRAASGTRPAPSRRPSHDGTWSQANRRVSSGSGCRGRPERRAADGSLHLVPVRTRATWRRW